MLEYDGYTPEQRSARARAQAAWAERLQAKRDRLERRMREDAQQEKRRRMIHSSFAERRDLTPED